MLRFSDITLRPLARADRERLLKWRNADRVRENMYNDHLITPDEHARWFDKALSDPLGRYLVCEYQGQPVGFVSFTGINASHGRCSWAFYLGETDVPRGTGSAMEFLALSYAFETLGVRKLCCEVFVFNAGVIKMHERFGFQHEGRFVQHYLKNGQYEDIVCLARFGADWNDDKAALRTRCFAAEK